VVWKNYDKKKMPSHLSNDSYIHQLRTAQETALISNFSATNLSSFSFLCIPLWGNYSHCYEPKSSLLYLWVAIQNYTHYVTIICTHRCQSRQATIMIKII